MEGTDYSDISDYCIIVTGEHYLKNLRLLYNRHGDVEIRTGCGERRLVGDVPQNRGMDGRLSCHGRDASGGCHEVFSIAGKQSLLMVLVDAHFKGPEFLFGV